MKSRNRCLGSRRHDLRFNDLTDFSLGRVCGSVCGDQICRCTDLPTEQSVGWYQVVRSVRLGLRGVSGGFGWYSFCRLKTRPETTLLWSMYDSYREWEIFHGSKYRLHDQIYEELYSELLSPDIEPNVSRRNVR